MLVHNDTLEISLQEQFIRLYEDVIYVAFGTSSLKSLGPKIWNCLLEELNSANNLNIFKNLLTQWNSPTCNALLTTAFLEPTHTSDNLVGHLEQHL